MEKVFHAMDCAQKTDAEDVEIGPNAEENISTSPMEGKWFLRRVGEWYSVYQGR